MSDIPLVAERLSRRAFLGASALGCASVLLSACTTTDVAPPAVAPVPPSAAPSEPAVGDTATMYAARTDEGYQLPAIPVAKLDPKFVRQIVADPTGEKPGTIVVDVSEHLLYLVRDGGKAIRYGVSLGKAGFGWTGSAVVQARKKWPVWTPPPEMIQRRPELAKYKDGMPPGSQSPLGARALYLFRDGKDTMYRLRALHESGHHRPLQPRQRPRPGLRAAQPVCRRQDHGRVKQDGRANRCGRAEGRRVLEVSLHDLHRRTRQARPLVR